MTQPLAGVSVVELAEGIAGPYCGKLLADFGEEYLSIPSRFQFCFVPGRRLSLLQDLTVEEEWGANNFVLLKYLAVHVRLALEQGRYVWNGEQIDLTLTEFAIVLFLVTQQGGDVSYRQIYDIVRGKDFVAGYGPDGYRANVRSFIKRIRKKFREIDDTFDHIENYPGFGYRWRSE